MSLPGSLKEGEFGGRSQLDQVPDYLRGSGSGSRVSAHLLDQGSKLPTLYISARGLGE